jgi:hypothetical protein
MAAPSFNTPPPPSGSSKPVHPGLKRPFWVISNNGADPNSDPESPIPGTGDAGTATTSSATEKKKKTRGRLKIDMKYIGEKQK